ncbi:hypothetical protein OIDMADRAFT_147042 [Oidiodendron maius Zn]|uniref:RING-type domain-containing protein n=1 Tax=Oidiodendron maius (strain Zn) TaxID=913774 RepID=A0A0C3H5C2_OIDMZ|nr:hypothetical protein OIDMADRAFT_147042 [Oidiodendron maius Zn]
MAEVNKISSLVIAAVGRRVVQATSETAPSPTALSQTLTSISPSATTSATSPPSIGGSNLPLFLVALGVAFAGLGVIVGIRYCVRYNARIRAIQNGEEIEPIYLQRMTTRPQHLRGKQLMTMDEVNERFPFLKYKNWAANRAKEGLSTNGGVVLNAALNHMGSEREAATITPSSLVVLDEHPGSEYKGSLQAAVVITEDICATVGTKRKSMETDKADSRATSSAVEEHNVLKEIPTTNIVDGSRNTLSGKNEDKSENEDEHIRITVAPELLSDSGDICAICISAMEQDHDIRGLTCGHAFHIGCIDPWLTARRACCPLCKTDYYTPKSVPRGEETEPERPGRVFLAPRPGDGFSYAIFEAQRMRMGGRAIEAALYLPRRR